MFCNNCGAEMSDRAVVCVKCGVPAAGGALAAAGGKTRLSYILLGIFLGCLGIHNFYAGYMGRAVAQLLITLALGWLVVPWICVYIWVIIEVCTVTKDAKGIPFS